MFADKELVNEFVAESKDHLSNIELEILRMESVAFKECDVSVDVVFRGVHTIKGVAGFLGLKNICDLSHAMETVLSKARSKECDISADNIDPLLHGVDLLRQMVENIDSAETYNVVNAVESLLGIISRPSTPSGEDDAIAMFQKVAEKSKAGAHAQTQEPEQQLAGQFMLPMSSLPDYGFRQDYISLAASHPECDFFYVIDLPMSEEESLDLSEDELGIIFDGLGAIAALTPLREVNISQGMGFRILISSISPPSTAGSMIPSVATIVAAFSLIAPSPVAAPSPVVVTSSPAASSRVVSTAASSVPQVNQSATPDMRELFGFLKDITDTVLMLDETDGVELEELCCKLEFLAEIVGEVGYVECSDICSSAAVLARASMEVSGTDRITSLRKVSAVIASLHDIIIDGKPFAMSDFPVLSSLESVSGDSHCEEVAPPVVFPPGVDEDVMSLYFEQERAALLEFEQEVLAFESTKTPDSVESLRRTLHTMKGDAGVVGLATLAAFIHKVEDYLEIPFATVSPDLLFGVKDALDKTFVALEKKDSPYSLQYIWNAVACATPRKRADVVPQKKVVDKPVAIEPTKPVSSAPPPLPRQPQPQNLSAAASAPVELDAPHPADTPQGAKALEIRRESSGSGDQLVKIDSSKLDMLLDTIGELVIAESIVANAPEILALRTLNLQRNVRHLSKITRLLQDIGMGMRLVPIENTFRKMARVVRDLSKKSGKPVDFAMEGEATELDRHIVEKLGDPLVHMVRNSVDHGIEETPAARAAVGKPEAGRILLKAFHKGGNINIQISDDGRGLDRAKILEKALEKGLVKHGESLADQEIYALIFKPGFSTAAMVTEISGRGVGMDVVRRNIDSLRGSINIETVLGRGTTFTIILPLTTAIIDAMSIKCGSETFMIPTLSVIESLRPDAKLLSTVAGRGETLLFRGSLLPMIRVSRLFHYESCVENPCEGIVVVVEESGTKAAILVDELLGQQQIVIKSLGEGVGKIKGISGACIMGDGRPGLILDISELLRMSPES